MNRIIRRLTLVMALATLAAGCVSQSIKTTSIPAVDTPSQSIADSELLDVSIAIFDPGLDSEIDDDSPVFTEVRQAEARYIPQLLMGSLQNSGAWGAVRVVPTDDQLTDLMISGKIVHSDGKTLTLEIDAVDATGHSWLDSKQYSAEASRYAYATTTRVTHDAFQAVYNRIANDLLAHFQTLS